MSGHKWRFFRAGGVDQVQLRDGADVSRLGELDQKLWMALAMPTRGLEFDPRTADLVDTDKDGRIRPPEVIAAVKWASSTFKDVGAVMKGGDSVPLANVADVEVLAGAKRILTSLKKNDATTISLADVSDTVKIFAETTFNGDGIVPADAAGDDAPTRQTILDIIETLGSVPDRSGKPGIDQARLDAFFDEATAFDGWMKKLEADATVAPVGHDATSAARDAVNAVKAKVEDFYARCKLAAFDPRAAAALNRDEKDYAPVGALQLALSSPEVLAFPLARIEPGRALPLANGVNPGWTSAVGTLAQKAVTPLLSARDSLSEADWSALLGKLAPFEAWQSSKPALKIEKLGLARVRALLGSEAKAKVAALIAQDKALEKEVAQLESVERLVRYQRDLFTLLINYVSFSDFYGKRGAVFQAGTLFLDARSCDLCIEVADAGKHAALAALSAGYLAYCDITRPGEAKRTVVAVFTNGDSDNLMVGRNGVFYDRKGRDWDATITKIVSNPISIREAFWLPYKKLIRAIEEQIAKRAQAADADSTAQMNAAASAVSNADKTPAKKEKEEKKLDLGTIALIGTAIGGVSALMGGFLTALFGLGMWMPIGVAGILLLISGPSMLLAFLKLRQRNLGPLLDANGWAINTKAKMNVPFGAALTKLAYLPSGSERSLDDPFAEKKRPWKFYLFVLAVLGGALFYWNTGRLDEYLPPAIQRHTPTPPAVIVAPVATPPAAAPAK